MKKTVLFAFALVFLLINSSCTDDSETLLIEKKYSKRVFKEELPVMNRDSTVVNNQGAEENEPCNPKPRR